jgi:uncharacterized phage-like protein YoqJ
VENKICVFSGHRSLPYDKLSDISVLLRREIIRQIDGGIHTFGCGGALGFDTLAALTVLDLTSLYPCVRLVLVLPCADQDKGWPSRDKERYRSIKERAHEVITLHDRYVYGCMQERNRYLVNCAGCLIAYLTRPRGGTSYTVHYAASKNVPVVNIAAFLG